jgi:predicted XRE-type DNA-binding protein
VDFHVISGNALADVGRPEPEVAPAKTQPTAMIGAIIDQRGWSETDAASCVQMERTDLSALLAGGVGDVSTEPLVRLLTALDHHVEIAVTPGPPSQLRASITVHADSEPAIAGSR